MTARQFTIRLTAASVASAFAVAVFAAPVWAADEVGSPLEDTTPSEAPISDELAAYGGDPANEAALVAQEERRLIDVDLVATGTLFPSLNTKLPFRLAGQPASTLVLPARISAYTEEDLKELAPLSFVETAPGVFLLSEHIVVLEGATLSLSRPGGMLINMASQDNGFASIVIAGGNLIVEGTPAEPIKFQAWDAQRSKADTTTADGRAYVRIMGGYGSITNASFSDMGFWSGVTGGLSLTGTELASTLGLDDAGEREIPEVYLAAPDTAITVEEGDPLVVDGTGEGEKGVDLTRGSNLYSNGVTAWLSGIVVNGNAYGVFVSDATSVELQNSTFTHNLVDGVVFHREVSNSRITGVESTDNGGDGFRVTRGSQGILLDTLVSANNKGNGITIDATPLADGPSATGLSSAAYGGHSVLNSRITNNGQYGIAVFGGDGITLSRNSIEGSQFGIMVTENAQNIAVDENRVIDPAKQGIALRDGVAATVWGNLVDGGSIGIYVRDSVADVSRNTVDGVTSHGVTLVGDVSGSIVAKNLIDGQGNSTIDSERASGADVQGNNETASWVYQNMTERILRIVTKPMTMLWTILALLLVLTAFRGFRYKGSGFGNPYKDRTPLHELTRGIVDPTTIPGVVRPLEVELREARRSAPELGGVPRRRSTDHDKVTA